MACGNDVILYAKFEDNLNDECGNHNGTWHGNEQYDIGKYGRAVSFDGSSYVSTNYKHFPSNWSISCWFKITTENTANGKVFGASTSDESEELSIRIVDGTLMILIIMNGYAEGIGPTYAELDVWHHIVIDSNGNYYFNKTHQGSHSNSFGPFISNNGLNIGARGDGILNLFGDVDEVYILKKIVTQEDVDNLYDGTYDTTPIVITPCPGDIITHYKFEDNSLDDCNNNYDGTWTGNEQYTDGQFDKAALFDGASYIDTGIIELESEFSFAFWFLMSDKTANSILISAGLGLEPTAFAIRYRADIDMLILDYITDYDIFQPEVNRLYHIAFTSTGDVYIDKVKVLTEAGSPEAFSFDRSLKLGTRSDVANFFSGYIDELYYIQKIVNQEDVDRLYAGTYPDPVSSPIPIKLGDKDVDNMMLGNQQVDCIYLGSNEIWCRS